MNKFADDWGINIDDDSDDGPDSDSDDDSDKKPSSKGGFTAPKLKPFPSVDLEDTIPEVVDDQEEELVDVKAAAATKKGNEASNELISFLSSCGIDDESVLGAFVAFGVQSPQDLAELVDEVRRT